MSRITLQNTKLNFNVAIVAVDRNDNGISLPLDIGAISSLEIDDNLIDIGITGSITYTNWFQVIDKLGVTEGRDKKTLYITIDIESEDGSEDSRRGEDDPRKISFIGLMESSISGGNIADAKQTYKFEEVITSRLKKMTLTNLKGVQPRGSVSSIIKSVLDKSRSLSNINVIDTSNVSLIDFHGNDDSIYVILYRLYNALRIVNNNSRTLPLIKAETIGEERQIQLRELLTDKHFEFVSAYINKEEGNYGEVYQEEFLIGPEERETGNSSLYNKVENYNHVKPNIGQLRQSLWGAYKLSGWKDISAPPDLTSVRSDFTDLNVFVEEFERYINQKSNIPFLQFLDQKTFEIEAQSSANKSTEIIEDIVYNKLWKSFIFRNEAIVLKVKGQVYRKPGVFITVQGALNTRDVPITDLWFVISNKHLFNNGNYENEITAVRFYGNVDRNFNN